MKSDNVTKVILSVIRKHIILTAGIIVAVAGAVITSLIPPLILAEIIDTITQGNTLPVKVMLIFFIFNYFLFIVLTGFTESIRECLLTVFGQKITHALRSTLMDKLTHMTAESLNHQEPGAVVSRFVGDVDTVENLFTSGIISMIADACRIISILAVIWFKNRGLAIVLFMLIPFIFWFTRIVQKNMLKAQLSNRIAVSCASGHVPETLHNIRTIHSLGKEKYMEEKYDTYIEESYRAIEKTNFYDALYSPIILITNAVVVAVVMMLSASGSKNVLLFFGMTAGTAVAVINYISQIFSPIESLGMEIQTIQSAVAGVHRINEFLRFDELPSEIKGDTHRSYEDYLQEDSVVSLKNVTFAYEDKKVLDNFNLEVKKGEQVTLHGRTGSGKSTVFKLILGLYEPQSGEVYVCGKKAGSIPDSEKRKTFGYVEQTFHMVPGTVKDQITLYDTEVSFEDVRDAAKMAGIDETIMDFENGYDTNCTEELLSQGQLQLLSIARAVVKKPMLLLLDEITANLDAQTEESVMKALKRVSEDRTVISISHRINAETGRVINMYSF